MRLVTILMLAVTLAGCSWLKKEVPPEPTAQAPAAQATAEAQTLLGATKEAQKDVATADEGLHFVIAKPAAAPVKADLEARVGVPLHAAKASAATAVAIAATHTVTTANVEAAVVADAKALDDANAKVEALTQEVKDVKANQFRNFLLWVQIAGFAIFVGAIPVFIWLDKTAGLSMAAGGLVVLGLAFFVNAYLVWIAWGAAALVAGITGYLGIKAWREHKNFVQSTKVAEACRQELPADKDAALFGVGAVPGKVSALVDAGQAKAVAALRKAGIVKDSL